MGVAAGWDPGLVVISYVVAVFASYTALDLAGRVSASSGTARALCLVGGALAMGTGIWSMHFTGMLAFKMEMPVAYEISLTLLSVVIATAASRLALFVVSRGLAGLGTLLIAGLVICVGIAPMHYTGMTAMVIQTTINYDPSIRALLLLSSSPLR